MMKTTKPIINQPVVADWYFVSRHTLNRVLLYLGAQPYAEVVELIQLLRSLPPYKPEKNLPAFVEPQRDDKNQSPVKE